MNPLDDLDMTSRPFYPGSTGRGDAPDLFTRTWAPADLAAWFVRRVWMLAFPQRRGRGLSQGRYDEGFTADRARYSCDPHVIDPITVASDVEDRLL